VAKESGLGWTDCSLDDASGTPQQIRNGCASLTIATPRAVADVTGLGMSAIERILLLADFSCELTGAAFDDAAGASHSVLKTVGSTSVARTLSLEVSGQSLDNEVLVTDYAHQRAQSGEFTWTAPCVLADGTVPTWS
jgi:hypothetical protein